MTLLWLCVANVGSPTRCMCILYELTTLQLFLVIGIVMRRSWDDEINVYVVGQSLRRCSDSGNCYRFYQLVSWCYFCDLIVPHVQTQRYVSRSFRVSGPTVWNSHKTYEAVTFPGNSSSVDLRHGCLSMLMCRWCVWEFFIEDALYKFTFWYWLIDFILVYCRLCHIVSCVCYCVFHFPLHCKAYDRSYVVEVSSLES